MSSQHVPGWQDKLFKGIIFFAVLGCIALFLGGYLINKTFSDIFSSSAPAEKPAAK